MAMGRPMKYTPETLDAKVDEYIESCYRTLRDSKGKPIIDLDTGEIERYNVKPITVSLFAVFAKINIDTVEEYRKREDIDFSVPIKKLYDRCLAYSEEQCFTAKNPAGAIFNLKVNWGKSEKIEIQTDINVNYSQLSDTELENKLLSLGYAKTPKQLEAFDIKDYKVL